MATANAKNRVYLFRLQMLVIDGGLLVLRNLLDQKLNVQNISLSTCLSQENSTITRLRGQNIITQVQYDLLYPLGGHLPSTADFDITLIICLLRSLKCCGFNRKFNWNVIPNASDLSVEADIYRLKLYRNEISHISTTTGIQLKYYSFKWTEIEQILLRLNTSVINPVPNLQQTIGVIKQSPLDPEAEKRIQKEVDEWKKLEKGVEVDLRQVKVDTQVIKEEVKQQHTSIQKVTGKVDKIEERTSEHSELIWGAQNKITDLEVDLRQVKVDDQSRQKELKLQQGKMEDIYKRTSENTELIRGAQNKVTDLEVDLRQVKVDDQSIMKEVKLQQGKMEEIYKRTSENTELVKGTQNRVDDLEKQITKNNESAQKQKEQKEINTQEAIATSKCSVHKYHFKNCNSCCRVVSCLL
ncbi:E3 ubiquitin-protein ligase DZIP3-like [Mercenaria mercenaria]|uniref:E3 ubiquitin-protein ligase DZIP3-like n=1 Tax=Mercenaria mercenaria TaxID=6596 RepID=UPI00234EF981|nr:E3 ubiquitin-protein ligase DZIP3-like [Mercenaria mercenaria]XP_053379435.1 E3 ubiquitin-protein ligase DZIP3-like [Mercenaria mercenaria]